MSNRTYYLSDKVEDINYGELVYVAHSSYEGEWASISHTHVLCEMFLVIGGEGTIYIEDQKIAIGPYDFIAINPNVKHREVSSEDNPLEYIVFGVGSISIEMDNSLYSKASFLSITKKVNFYTEELLHIGDRKNNHHLLMIQNIYELLFLEYLKISGNKAVASITQQVMRECNQAKRYMEAHYAENISLDLLAEELHLNKYYLSHCFTKTYGISLMNYLTSVRIQVSKKLLKETDYNIASIANSCGFTSQSYFSQSFKKIVKMTPYEFRKHNK
ncbi:AraC family transcriptional regulator [Vallitaleaceae bacterium 9-2]